LSQNQKGLGCAPLSPTQYSKYSIFKVQTETKIETRATWPTQSRFQRWVRYWEIV